VLVGYYLLSLSHILLRRAVQPTVVFCPSNDEGFRARELVVLMRLILSNKVKEKLLIRFEIIFRASTEKLLKHSVLNRTPPSLVAYNGLI
jgi:hypothetical protein